LDIDISVACILLKDEILILKNKNTCISSDFSKHLCCILRIFKNNLWNEFKNKKTKTKNKKQKTKKNKTKQKRVKEFPWKFIS
jgi:hypothetical protein